jgi:hypothetical protein
MGGREAIARKEGKEKQLNGMNEDRGDSIIIMFRTGKGNKKYPKCNKERNKRISTGTWQRKRFPDLKIYNSALLIFLKIQNQNFSRIPARLLFGVDFYT